MSKKGKNNPASTSSDNNNANYDVYNEDRTKEIVGGLFDEFVEDGDTNYFADYSDPFLDVQTEDDESLQESISRRRKRNVTTANKSIVFRKKTKKIKPEDIEPDEDEYDDNYEEDNEPAGGADLEKTIILPKLSNFFKKSDEDDEASEDDEIDEFFASLTKDSAARAQAAASEEPKQEKPAPQEPNEDKKVKKAKRQDVEPAPAKPAVSKKPKQQPLIVEDDDNDEYEEKLVEISLVRIAAIVVSVIAVVVITALAYKCHSYSKQLNEARSQITELQKSSSSTYETELNELKAQVSELTAENESLKANTATADDPHTAAVEILNEAQSELTTQEAPNTNLSQGESGGNTYTVKKGDTFWDVSQSVYGNGADFQKILDANNLTENSILNEGQVLKIPN